MSRNTAIFLAFTAVPALGATISTATEVAEQRRQLQGAGEVKLQTWVGLAECAVNSNTALIFDGNIQQGSCVDNEDGTSSEYACDGCTVNDNTYQTSDCSGSSDFYSYSSGGCFAWPLISFKVTCPGCDDGDDPCFAKDSTHAVLKSGEHVLMSSLRAGDLVKDGPNSYTRVVVNQHAAVEKASSLINVEHTNGSLALTPDHCLFIDGKLGAARDLKTGSMLGDAQVLRLSMSNGNVINPITVSGKILAVGRGEPVVAASHPDWIAQYLLDSYVPLPFSLSNLISYLFPATTQDYYDEHLENIPVAPQLKQWKADLPSAAIPAAVVVVDVAISVGFVAYALSSPKVAIGLATVFVGKKLARKA